MSENETENKASNGVKRAASALAALGLIFITGGAVFGLVYDVVLNEGGESLSQLGSLATLGLGGLLALSGARKGE